MQFITQIMRLLPWLLLLPLVALAREPVPEIGFTLLDTIQRPADHFTQGLYYDGEHWWESSGLYGRSWIAEYTHPGRNPLRRKWLAADRFAEGLTVVEDRIYLLTYRAGELHVYDRNFTPKKILRYRGEGWGLTDNGQQLIMSNGSDELSFRNLETFAEERRVKVHGGGRSWTRLNELEYVDGVVWANIWMDTRIAAIDAQTGRVLGTVDLKTLVPEIDHPDAVANGIAWDKARNGLWVTGKYWPKLYLIRPQGLGFNTPEG